MTVSTRVANSRDKHGDGVRHRQEQREIHNGDDIEQDAVLALKIVGYSAMRSSGSCNNRVMEFSSLCVGSWFARSSRKPFRSG